ncbi:MAG: glycosyltransferase family 39 protein [Anaerolineae bacterium]|nr:glycosyltransferase family 39 protein [Anaerolineae bacterium]
MQHLRSRAKTIWSMTAILLAGAALRLWRLTDLGLEHDEVANWLIDRSILNGNHAVYFTDAYGHEAGFHYMQAAFVALLGDNALALRLPAALAGIVLIAVTFALLRLIFGRKIALIAAALLAVTFFPVFYSRLGLRAITLPVLSALSFYFFWQATMKGGRRKAEGESPFILHPLSLILAGLFAGLSLYTYMAARAVPIFYTFWVAYLVIFQRDIFKRHWRGIALFAGIYLAMALPLLLFLQGIPEGEFRIAEIDAPLRALLAGDIGPALLNGVKIAGAFGVRGDPLWRQNVAGWPIFNILAAILFYAGVVIALWRHRPKHVFVLLWAATAALPSIVTTDAPSTIRMINILPVLTIFPALSIHSLGRLSTTYPKLSTTFRRNSWITLLTIILFWASVRTISGIFVVWPSNDEVQFVWQTALTAAARELDDSAESTPVAIMGWSPDTMDSPTLELALIRDDLDLRFFGGIKPEPIDSLILPLQNGAIRIVRPSILPLDPALEALLTSWGATVTANDSFTRYDLKLDAAEIVYEQAVGEVFGDELTLLGFSAESCLVNTPCAVTTYWRVEQIPAAPRTLFLHALGSDANLVAQDDGLDVPAAQWQPGDIIVKQHTLTPPEDPMTTLYVGVYQPQTLQRLLTSQQRDAVTLER